jgi:phosphoserine phosphatase RsbU/P
MLRGMTRRHTAIQYAVFHPQTQEMQIASAGMPGPFHLTAQCCRSMEISRIPPGLFQTACYEIARTQLEAGDSVFFCTDGLTDAFDRHGEQFGTGRLQEICEAERKCTPVELLGRVFAAVESFTRGRAQHDDMATAVFHLAGTTAPPGVATGM